MQIKKCSLNEFGHPEIQGTDLNQLIERLTQHQYIDREFTNYFLFTYRYFTQPLNLLNCLKERYYASKLEDSTEDETQIIPLIQMRVATVLFSWIESRFSCYDFDDPNSEFSVEVITFLEVLKNNPVCRTEALNSESLLLQIFKTDPRPTQTELIPLPVSLMAEDTPMTILSFDVQTIADFIAFKDYEVFAKIQPQEFLNQSWNKPQASVKSPNIIEMTNRFNNLGNWVVYEVLSGVTPKDRCQLVLHLFQVAKELQEMNDLNGMCAIMSGLINSSIVRLKKTFAKLAKKEKSTVWEDMTKAIMGEENFKTLRRCWANAKPPAVPFLAITLKDLTFLEDGNPTFLQDGGINFYKFRKIGEVVQEIASYQHLSYPSVVNPDLQSYIQTKSEQATQEGTMGLYRISKKREP
uniref:Ras-GEF domain-containing protein n=1 Tax=Arcella intermedia TaxID=1963864 RepID=A0A6B2L5N7_9EUKA